MDDRIVFQFEIGGYFQGHKTLTVRETPSGLTRTFEVWPMPEGDHAKTLPVTAVQMERLDSLAERCDVAGWEEHYDAPVLDGEQWSLSWHGLERCGSNAYPEEFDAFLDGLEEIFGSQGLR